MFEALKGPNSKTERGPSTQNKQDGGNILSADEKLAILVEKGIKVLLENWRENILEKGHKAVFVAFGVPETDHEGILKLEKEPRMGREGNWRLSIGVHRERSRRMHAHFLCHGDGQEGLEKVLAYLNQPEFKAELLASVKELFHHVDQDDYD
ncbi:MAG: hypothetical protein K2K53_03415 [Oscillospiraceae bacterium]|nr:hypothetical protein [Oscillospiraceae bacterium]